MPSTYTEQRGSGQQECGQPAVRPSEMVTSTFREGDGGGRDTDVGSNRPVQSLAGAVCPDKGAENASTPSGDTARLPSFILRFAEPVAPSVAAEPTMEMATETFNKSDGSARDTDVSAYAASTETHIADPRGRDTDVDQLDYAPIGAKIASSVV